jgi:hypothetical protein
MIPANSCASLGRDQLYLHCCVTAGRCGQLFLMLSFLPAALIKPDLSDCPARGQIVAFCRRENVGADVDIVEIGGISLLGPGG